MSTEQDNVVPLSTPGKSGSGGGNNFGERLARIETKLEYTATREDVSEIKVLIERKEASQLRWLVGLVFVALVTLAAAVIRTFL